ncbi:hypothetical protein [Panacagrimonas sp.]|uniref:AbrB/MazE/SpoVT family DNA-binding domain-containing protein n=1 Tax=Panacagrimonas sp. TaxID=2480088 RepID=UPI003B527060
MPVIALRRAGGSVTFTVPPMYLKQTGLGAGHHVDVEIKDDALTIRPVARKRISLAQIIQGTPKSVAKLRSPGWDEMPPTGHEA